MIHRYNTSYNVSVARVVSEVSASKARRTGVDLAFIICTILVGGGCLRESSMFDRMQSMQR
jgi:hypothetical protein